MARARLETSGRGMATIVVCHLCIATWIDPLVRSVSQVHVVLAMHEPGQLRLVRHHADVSSVLGKLFAVLGSLPGNERRRMAIRDN